MPASIAFENHTKAAGVQKSMPTFPLAVVDINRDGQDDILVGVHNRSPDLFLNNNGIFQDVTESIGITEHEDRHGYTVVDIDNDADRDFIYAGGGADGMDFLRIGQLQARLYENRNGSFAHIPTRLDSLKQVLSTVSADLNNDGFPDLYVGGVSGHSHVDNISNTPEELHFSVTNQDTDEVDHISFKTSSFYLKINFRDHIPQLGKTRTDVSDIHIGANKVHIPYRLDRFGKKGRQGHQQTLTSPAPMSGSTMKHICGT